MYIKYVNYIYTYIISAHVLNPLMFAADVGNTNLRNGACFIPKNRVSNIGADTTSSVRGRYPDDSFADRTQQNTTQLSSVGPTTVVVFYCVVEAVVRIPEISSVYQRYRPYTNDIVGIQTTPCCDLLCSVLF